LSLRESSHLGREQGDCPDYHGARGDPKSANPGRILKLISDGKTNKEIADLFLSAFAPWRTTGSMSKRNWVSRRRSISSNIPSKTITDTSERSGKLQYAS
jgi:hypothetical protein